MSLLKIINARKNPLNIISEEGSDHCEQSEKVVKFMVVSDNPTESLGISGRVGGDRGSKGSFSLSVGGGSNITLHTLSYEGGEVSDTVTVPTNTTLELRISSQTPTSKIEGGVERILSTSCNQSSSHSSYLVSTLHVDLKNQSLSLQGSFSTSAYVWADDREGGGLGGGLIP